MALSVIGAGWFYHAVEDFKYVTIRTTIIRFLLLVALFLFVHKKEDLVIYAIIHMLGETGGNLFNFFRLRKYLRGTHISLHELHPLKHLKPSLQLFVLNIIVSIYISLDSVMLGFINNDTAVGYYTPPLRLARASIGIVGALGTVLFPRFANMAINKRMDEFNALAEKAIGFVISLSLPMMVGLIALAPAAIHLYSGSNYEPSILTLQLLAPIIPAITLSGIIGMQILYSQGKEKIVIRATAVGAIANFTLNLCLLPHYAQWGAAFSTSVAEGSVALMCIILGRRYFCFSFRAQRNINYFIGTAFLILWLFLLNRLIHDDLFLILTAVPSSVVIYFGFLYLRGDRFVLQLISICRRWREFL
jgi:O-antigen/teichoic acid export membrane protein